VSGLIGEAERVLNEGRERYLARQNRPPGAAERRKAAEALEPRVREIIASLDARGRWVEDGLIRSQTFVRNVEALADYLAAARGRELQRVSYGL
jgi:hypothetical protein